MAYNLADRFPAPPKLYTFYDPGAYQIVGGYACKENKAGFNSKVPRQTNPCNKIWTEVIYSPAEKRDLPNISAFISKSKRFPYESLSAEDIEQMLCRCGFQQECECGDGEDDHNNELLCQGTKRRKLVIGLTPRAMATEGLSAPGKYDRGFKVTPDGKKERILKNPPPIDLPFYNTVVEESTQYYRGCKWGRWTSKRSTKTLEQKPGPADYDITKKITDYERCIENVRSHRRKTSKQPRFIELVQRQNILEGRPGPGAYNAFEPKCAQSIFSGSKAKRFVESNFNVIPEPTKYSIKREFDPPEPLKKLCHAKLSEPACFGVNDKRFKPLKEEGPSPANYEVHYKPCNFMRCGTTAFNSSASRWKEEPYQETGDDEELEGDEDEVEHVKECPDPSWMLKSRTLRMKPFYKKYNEPSPADLAQPVYNIGRSRYQQYLAPFMTSEGRFEPWNDWMPVFGKEKTPGPCCYSLEKPKCNPAVHRGPLCRSKRFSTAESGTPAPNHYDVDGGIETILHTHNERLKGNLKNQHSFTWSPAPEKRKLTLLELESLLIENSIALLEVSNEKTQFEKEEARKLRISNEIKELTSSKTTKNSWCP